MRLRTAVALSTVALVPLGACSTIPTTIEELRYQIDQPVTALVIEARAAGVAITVGDGPVTITEEHRYSSGKPVTGYHVHGQTLRLTESGCPDDNARCEVRYTIRIPETMSVDITAQAGAVKVDGLAGKLTVATQAGAVEGRGLTSDEVSVTTEVGAASLVFTQPPDMVHTTTSLGAVELHLPGSSSYAVDIRTEVGTDSVDVDQDPASVHRVSVRTEVGNVQIKRMP
jgi:DUF4097 and DUF4098 domain-containing protein YvlB